MNKKLIALAQAGKVAVVNDGTVEELNEVNMTIKYRGYKFWGGYKFYYLFYGDWKISDTAPSLPCHSVREFLQDEKEQDHGFKWGEEVMWDNVHGFLFISVSPTDSDKAIIFCPIPAAVTITDLSRIHRITPKRRITRAEIKEKLGIEGEWEILD